MGEGKNSVQALLLLKTQSYNVEKVKKLYIHICLATALIPFQGGLLWNQIRFESKKMDAALPSVLQSKSDAESQQVKTLN